MWRIKLESVKPDLWNRFIHIWMDGYIRAWSRRHSGRDLPCSRPGPRPPLPRSLTCNFYKSFLNRCQQNYWMQILAKGCQWGGCVLPETSHRVKIVKCGFWIYLTRCVRKEFASSVCSPVVGRWWACEKPLFNQVGSAVKNPALGDMCCKIQCVNEDEYFQP